MLATPSERANPDIESPLVFHLSTNSSISVLLRRVTSFSLFYPCLSLHRKAWGVAQVVCKGFTKKDNVLACTDLNLTAKQVIELYCQRWSLEETFGWVKSRLGFENPRNRTEHAVQHTAPMAMWTYSLVILWVRGLGQTPSAPPRPPCALVPDEKVAQLLRHAGHPAA